MSTKQKKSLGLVVVLLLAMMAATTGRAKAAKPPASTPTPTKAVAIQQNTSAPMVEPLADGTKDPASISDAVALRALFMTTSPGDIRRIRAKFGRTQLEEADMKLLVQGLDRLQGLAGPQQAQIAVARSAARGNPSRAAFDNLAALDRQLDTIAADTYRELLLSLSPAGAAKLREHVAYAKTKIKIMPPPNMTMRHH